MSIPSRPAVAPAPEWSFPRPDEWALDNGLRVAAVDVPGQYVISVRLGIPLPPAMEPRELEGLIVILSRVFDEGTLDHDAETFAELLERSGAALGSSTTEYGLTLECDLPRTRLSEGLELFSEAVRRPAFPDDEVQRAVKRRLADIEQETADPRHRAAREFAATFYEDGCRASRPTGGTPDTVSAITADDVRSFYAEHVGPVGATLTIAGDLGDRDEVRRLLAATFGSWVPQGAPAAAAQVPRRRDDAARIVIVDRPGAVQTELYLGCLAPARRSPDQWAPYPVISFLVGGSPQARVDAVLREQKGFTYGIRSGLVARHGMSAYITSGSVRSEVTAEALQTLMPILEGTTHDGFTAAELRSGVDFVTKTAPARYATADAVADETVHLALEGRRPSDITATLAATRGLSATDLDDAYRAIDTGEWTIVLVADAATVEDGVRGLALGPVEVRRG